MLIGFLQFIFLCSPGPVLKLTMPIAKSTLSFLSRLTVVSRDSRGQGGSISQQVHVSILQEQTLLK